MDSENSDSKNSTSKDKTGVRDLDIQHIGLRLMHIYEGIDTKLRGTRLVNVIKSPGVPSDVPVAVAYSQLPCTEYFVECTESEIQPDRNTFYIPEIIPLFPRERDREDIYWQLRLMYGCGLLPIALIELSKLLEKAENGGYSDFVGFFHNSEGEIVQEKIRFEDLSLRSLDYEPKAIHLLRRDYGFKIRRTEKIEMMFGNNVVAYNLLVCQDRWILDLSGMQFKMRGSNGELIGRLETIKSYLDRFPASAAKLDEPDEYSANSEFQTLHKMNLFYIDKILEVVLEDILQNRKWCSYCGKLIGVSNLCGACRSPAVNYCDKWCQKSDWKGHKLFCGKKVKVGEGGEENTKEVIEHAANGETIEGAKKDVLNDDTLEKAVNGADKEEAAKDEVNIEIMKEGAKENETIERAAKDGTDSWTLGNDNEEVRVESKEEVKNDTKEEVKVESKEEVQADTNEEVLEEAIENFAKIKITIEDKDNVLLGPKEEKATNVAENRKVVIPQITKDDKIIKEEGNEKVKQVAIDEEVLVDH